MILQDLQQNELAWFGELGIGYYPVKAMPYDEAYFENYVKMADTEIGYKLNKARVDFVNKYTQKDVLDIGIGSGAFVLGRENTKGYDINPAALEWLIDRKLYRHPFRGANALTFWDSLEHIHNPQSYLEGAKEYVFISCPIYDNFEHILKSKHFKKNEHCWYWTIEGIVRFMHYYGFEVIECNWQETEIGREGIASFAFKRY